MDVEQGLHFIRESVHREMNIAKDVRGHISSASKLRGEQDKEFNLRRRKAQQLLKILREQDEEDLKDGHPSLFTEEIKLKNHIACREFTYPFVYMLVIWAMVLMFLVSGMPLCYSPSPCPLPFKSSD